MTTPARVATKPSPIPITPADERVLLALNRSHHLSAEQVRRLLYGQGSLKYAYDRLAPRGRRLRPARPGARPALRLSLTGRGRSYAEDLGLDVLPRRRHAGEGTGASYYRHALAVADVLIAAELLSRAIHGSSSRRSCHDRELKHPPGARAPRQRTTRGVIPDGWLDLRVAMADGRFRITWCLSRPGHRRARRWQQKVEAFIAFADGPYQEDLRGTSLSSPSSRRRARHDEPS